jgi:hypothetical protein
LFAGPIRVIAPAVWVGSDAVSVPGEVTGSTADALSGAVFAAFVVVADVLEAAPPAATDLGESA